jgi:hypothetical protein
MRRRKNSIDLGLDLRNAIKRVSASYEAVLQLDPLTEDEALLRLARATHQADQHEVTEAERLLAEARQALAATPLPDDFPYEE